MAVCRFHACLCWTHRFSVDLHTAISCPRYSYFMAPVRRHLYYPLAQSSLHLIAVDHPQNMTTTQFYAWHSIMFLSPSITPFINQVSPPPSKTTFFAREFKWHNNRVWLGSVNCRVPKGEMQLSSPLLTAAVTAESPTTPIGNFSTTDATTALITTVEASSNSPCFPCWWQGISFFVQNLLIFIRYVVTQTARDLACHVKPMCDYIFTVPWCSNLAERKRRNGDSHRNF